MSPVNKQYRVIFNCFISLILTSIFFYLCGVFISGTFDSNTWDQCAKVLAIFVDLSFTIIISAILNVGEL